MEQTKKIALNYLKVTKYTSIIVNPFNELSLETGVK